MDWFRQMTLQKLLSTESRKSVSYLSVEINFRPVSLSQSVRPAFGSVAYTHSSVLSDASAAGLSMRWGTYGLLNGRQSTAHQSPAKSNKNSTMYPPGAHSVIPPEIDLMLDKLNCMLGIPIFIR